MVTSELIEHISTKQLVSSSDIVDKVSEITGIKQENIGLLLAHLLDERGHFCYTTDHRNVIEPERRDGVIGTFDIVGKQ